MTLANLIKKNETTTPLRQSQIPVDFINKRLFIHQITIRVSGFSPENENNNPVLEAK